jgi:hypothetical protein
MSDLRAEPLSPIDAATLWPQLGRLGNEVLAPRSGESLLISSALAATGLGRLPRLPRTVVLGVRRGLRYRGVLVARDLAGGTGWEVLSLRLGHALDEEALEALLEAVSSEVAARRGRTVYLRYPDGSPYRTPIRRGGFMPYGREFLYSLPPRPSDHADWVFRPARPGDRHAIFRLYCRVVPEHIRRSEAPLQQDWRAVLGSYDCDDELLLDHEGGLSAWVGIGRNEARILSEPGIEGLVDAALDICERHLHGLGVVVAGEYQFELLRNIEQRGYALAGIRCIAARRLAAALPLKEVVKVPADTAPVPQ